MDDSVYKLQNFKKEHDFLICIDSDGCVFDSMGIKQHKTCFAPNFISHWGLRDVEKPAREVWEFVNLYSSTRGVNRFRALVHALDLASNRKEIRESGWVKPDLTPLRQWIEKTRVLANSELEKEMLVNKEPILQRTLDWSNGINRTVSEKIKGVPPFPDLRKALKKASEAADLLVVSATPMEALVREWDEHGLSDYVQVIAGQEAGTKEDHIRIVMEGRYDRRHVLKIGDAPGDLKAAQANGVLFYPIIPGSENESWLKFYDTALERFLAGTYEGEYQSALVEAFNKSLPDTPNWDY